MARAWLAQGDARPTLAPEPLAAGDRAVGDGGSLSGFITWGEPGQGRRVRERQLVLLQASPH